MNDGFLAMKTNEGKMQKTTHCDLSKNIEKWLFLIHQSVDSNIFKKIIEEETTKGVWDTLQKLFWGDEKVKKVKFQSLRKQYENTQNNEGEIIEEFFSRLVVSTN